MNRQELRRLIGRATCELRNDPSECADCATRGGCPDAWPEEAAGVDAAMALVDEYCADQVRAVAMDAYVWGWDASDSDIPPVSEERVRAWLALRGEMK